MSKAPALLPVIDDGLFDYRCILLTQPVTIDLLGYRSVNKVLIE